MNRSLGSNQSRFLVALIANGGTYSSRSSRWVWGTAYDTVDLLASLVRRSLVHESVNAITREHTWTVTETGRVVASSLSLASAS